MNIVIVDDHRIVRDGLKALLMSEPADRVVGEAMDDSTLQDLLRHKSVDLVVLDLKLQDISGLDILSALKDKNPTIKVLMMSGEWNTHTVQTAIRLKVDGIMAKESSHYVFKEALSCVENGKFYIDPGLMDMAFSREPDPLSELSNREQEIMRCFARGKTYKEIAAELHISSRTVETHKNNILKKLSLNTTYDMILLAMKYKMV